MSNEYTREWCDVCQRTTTHVITSSGTHVCTEPHPHYQPTYNHPHSRQEDEDKDAKNRRKHQGWGW